MSGNVLDSAYGVFITIPELAERNKDFAFRYIRNEDLCTKNSVFGGRGIETDPHITVHMQLPHNLELIKEICSKIKPFKVEISGYNWFESPEKDDKKRSWDVLIRNVHSAPINEVDRVGQDPLVTFHNLIGKKFHKKWHRTEGYYPHLTIAYLVPGKGSDLYKEILKKETWTFIVNEVSYKKYKDRGSTVIIPLGTDV